MDVVPALTPRRSGWHGDQNDKLRQLVDILIVLIHTSTVLTLGVFLVSFQSAPTQTMSASEELLGKAEHEGAVFFGIPEELIRKAITEGFKKTCPDVAITAGLGGAQATIDRFPAYIISPEQVFCRGSRVKENTFLRADEGWRQTFG